MVTEEESMNTIDLIILNFEEVRRRSIKLWNAIPLEYVDWKPDEGAMTCAEMVVHVLESEHIYHQILLAKGTANFSGEFSTPFTSKPFKSIEEELEFAKPYRENFIQYIKELSPKDLDEIKIDRSDAGYIRTLGDMLLRIAYHESVHTGQLLDYMRTMNVDRPRLWD